MRSKWLITVMAALVSAGGLRTWAADGAGTGTVLLTLVEGVRPGEEGDRETRDMELELTLRDGKFEQEVWGYAAGFNKGSHEGQIVSAEGDKLTVKMVLRPDRWWPPKPGEAEYQITLQRDGENYKGSFTGTFGIPGAEGLVKTNVKGRVTGKVYPLWTEPVAGFKKLEPNEHPRLIFRKSDLPMIKKRMETPEGKAIMERFMEMLPKQHAVHPKNQPFFPAGYALAYQLTGDKAHADKAKELLDGMLNVAGSQDIHYGPIAQSMAVSLDMCYDAWDQEFRQKVIDNLARRVSNLIALNGMGGASMSPWHNHEGVRAPSAGVAAICLLGEKTSDGKEIPGLERDVQRIARITRRYFQFNGTSNSGWCLEGSFYKRMTWNSGPGHMIQAYRTAFGGDLLAGWWGHGSIIGEWMQQPPSEKLADDLGVDQSSGLWPVGLVSVPDSMKAGTRWLYDRAFGLEGNKTFGILWAYHAGYVLMNYPFDTPPQPPATSLPWIMPDPTGGHWIFRKPWQDANDTLAVIHLRSGMWRGCHSEYSGRTWDMQLFALGRQWIGDPKMGEKGSYPSVAQPTVSYPGAYNDVLGPITTYWNATADGKAVLSMDMSPIFMKAMAKGEVPAAGQKVASFVRTGKFIDYGIVANRSVALDFSGSCGAPALFVVVDKTQGAKDYTWNMQLAKEAGEGKVDGNTVTVGDPAGDNLKCTFIATKAPTITGAITATGSEEYFVVITVQKGAAPALKVEGEGLAAKVTVGSQTISFDGTKIVLGK